MRWFQKCVELLRQEVPRFFLRKMIFCKIFQVPKKFIFSRGFCTFLKSAQSSAYFDTLYAQFWINFFSAFIRDGTTFLEDKRSNKIETVQYFKKHFLETSLRISRPNLKHIKHWISKKMSKSLDPTLQFILTRNGPIIEGPLCLSSQLLSSTESP